MKRFLYLKGIRLVVAVTLVFSLIAVGAPAVGAVEPAPAKPLSAGSILVEEWRYRLAA